MVGCKPIVLKKEIQMSRTEEKKNNPARRYGWLRGNHLKNKIKIKGNK